MKTNRSAEEVLQGPAQLLEALFQVLLRLFDLLKPLGERAVASARAAPAVRRLPGAGALAAAAARTLAAQLAEHVYRLRIETPRAARAFGGQPVAVEAHVAHQRRIGDAGPLGDLGQRQQVAGRRLAWTSAASRFRRRGRTSTARARGPLRSGLAPARRTSAALRRRLRSALRRVLARPAAPPRVLLLDLIEYRQRALGIPLLAPLADRWDAALVRLLVALQRRHRNAGS